MPEINNSFRTSLTSAPKASAGQRDYTFLQIVKRARRKWWHPLLPTIVIFISVIMVPIPMIIIVIVLPAVSIPVGMITVFALPVSVPRRGRPSTAWRGAAGWTSPPPTRTTTITPTAATGATAAERTAPAPVTPTGEAAVPPTRRRPIWRALKEKRR